MLSNADFKASYGSLYANVEYFNHNEALKYNFYFCVRRLLNAGIIAFCQKSIVLQVFLLVKVSLIATAWAIKHKPMIDGPNNIILITNELVILCTSYLVLVFSDYVPNVEERYQFGYGYLGFFAFETMINVIMLLVITVRDILKFFKRRRLTK